MSTRTITRIGNALFLGLAAVNYTVAVGLVLIGSPWLAASCILAGMFSLNCAR